MKLTLAGYRNRIVNFVRKTWGSDVLFDMKERVARVVEEAVEFGQAGGIDEEMVKKIVARVYSRPVGIPGQEAAGVGLTLLAWTHVVGADLDVLLDLELTRIENLPTDHFRQKHADKVAAGTSTVACEPPEEPYQPFDFLD